MYDHATFQDGSPAHSESVDTKTRPGSAGTLSEAKKGVGVWCINAPTESGEHFVWWEAETNLKFLVKKAGSNDSSFGDNYSTNLKKLVN